MKKKMKAIWLLVLLTCNLTSHAQFIGISDLEMSGLRGPVKEIKEYRISEEKYLDVDTLAAYQQRGLQPPYFKRELYYDTEYDKDGYITSRMEYGGLAYPYTKTYIAPGKMQEQTFYNVDGTVKHRYTFKYDEEGNLVSAVKKAENEIIFRETYSFNPKENMLSCIHLGADGTGHTAYVKKRPNGKLEYMKYKRNGAFYQQYFFDEQGRATEYYHTTSTGSFHEVLTQQGRRRTVAEYEILADGSEKLKTKRYDELDEYDNVLSQETFDVEGVKISYKTMTYKYDNHGNWIYLEQKGSRGYWDENIKERVITYY